MCHSSVATINNYADLHSQPCGLGTKLDDEHNHTHMKFHKRNEKYSRGNYNILQVQYARECASASDPFAVARVLSSLTCERLARFITFLVSGTVLIRKCTYSIMETFATKSKIPKVIILFMCAIIK